MSQTITEVCIGCSHPISEHFNDVTGVARCRLVIQGETTRGVIGLPYTLSCLCANFKLPESQEVSE